MANNRSISVTLRANVQDFKSQFDAATRAAEQTAKGTEDSAKRSETAMGRMVQSAQDNRQAWETSGRTLTAFGAAALGGLGFATKAAIDWETAWAGVLKTVDGTPEQLNAIEDGLRGMARELPASHAEIAAVAEAAGQLGIETPNILGFTRTMIDMGEATNMTAETAAMSLARFMNITGTAQSDIGRLGATVVGLGNNFASTESEIVEMSQRIAGAGAQAGMTEGDIMGMATALSSVGIEAQAGGSAISRTMTRIGMEVDTGGEKLETFAMVAGMSAQEFSDAWSDDPAQALDAFITGLSDTEQMGMSTNEVLSELGITAIREADALRRLAGSGGIAADAMAMGNAEFEKGTALIEEASQRYETAESRIAMARNALVDMGISVGQVVLPALAGLADGAADAFGWFADLPGAVHGVAGALAGVTGAAGLGAGAFLLLAPRVLDTVSAFRDLGAISPGTASRVGRMTLAIGKVGLGIGAAIAVFPAFVRGANAAADAIQGINREALDLGMNELTSNLMEAGRSGDAFNAILGDLYNSGAVTTDTVENLGEAVQKVAFLDTGTGIEGWFASVGNAAGMTRRDIQSLQDRFEGAGEALTLMAQTDLPMAQEAFSAFWEDASAGGATFEEVMTVLPGFRDALIGIAEGMGAGTDDATLLRIATGELSPVVDEATGAVTGFTEGLEDADEGMQSAAEAADELYDKMSAVTNGFLDARQAARDYSDVLKEANDIADENGDHWEDGSEAAREHAEAIDAVARSVEENAGIMKQNGEDVGGYLQEQREVLWQLAKDFGATDDEATAYVDSLGLVPDEIQTIIDVETDAAREKWEQIYSELWPEGGHPPMVIDPEVDPDGKVPEFTGLVSDIPPETNTDVNADTDEAAEKMWGFAGVLGETTDVDPVEITADTMFGEQQLRAFQTTVNEAGGTVEINGATMTGEEALDFLLSNIDSAAGTVEINGEDYPATTSLSELIAAINDSHGEVDVYASTSAAEADANHTARDRSSHIYVNSSTGAASQAIDNAARDRYSRIYVSYSVRGGVPTMNVGNRTATARAMGGAINGPGTGTSDSVPIMASNGEHMWTAAEVSRAGGHQAMYHMRQQIMAGAKSLHLATGGGIENGTVAPVRSMPVYQQARQSSGPVTATIPPGLIASEIRQGMQSATVIAQVSDRVAANLHQRGKSANRAFGGKQ